MEEPEKRRVAKPAVSILLGVMFKRYSTAGVLSILVLFLNLKLGYDKDASTAIYHAYGFIASSLAIFGAIIADSYLGMYKTLLLMPVILAAGPIAIAIGVIDALLLPLNALSIVALVVMAFGDGCLKPLNRSYVANQYKSNEVNSITLYFVLYYLMYNIGSIIARLISPTLRQDVKCFGNDDCFTLAFGIPGIFMIFVAVLVVIANKYSATTQTKGPTLLNVLACIWHAITMNIKTRSERKASKNHHWLDHAQEKYGKVLVWDTRVILNVIVLYIPITLFWALFYQQGSRWVFQALRMNGNIGFYTIIPDQLNVLNPLLVILLIPIFEHAIYPLLLKVGIRSDLQKVTLGGVLAGLSFSTSALVESQIYNDNYHMAWLIPQYVLMAMGEILVTVPMMDFSYTVEPNSIKTVLQAFNNFAMGLGNLIVVMVVGSKMMDAQALADSYLGMYKTIILMSILFSVGSRTLAIVVIDALYLPTEALTIVALAIMSFGGGCLKPLSRAYGALQYNPTEVKSIALFFMLYYFLFNCGSILSRVISPILRQDVKCFGNDDCFSLAFGIPGIRTILAAVLVVLANKYSNTSQTLGSTLLNVFACIWHAIAMKIKSRSDTNMPNKNHWLDYSEEKYGKTLVWETQHILRVGVLSLPLTIFWSLFYQEGSLWIFQAVRMNGDLGFYTILPDQLPVVNPLLVLCLIPVFECIIYPLLSKVGITNDLEKVTLGGVCAGIAFLVSAIEESQIGNDKDLHMAWLLPQFILMTMGEILVTIPMMNFSYAEAPSSMKTVLQAWNNLSIGLGNLIVVVVVRSKLIESQIYEFILFAVLMFVDMIIFRFLTKRFKSLKTYVDETTSPN